MKRGDSTDVLPGRRIALTMKPTEVTVRRRDIALGVFFGIAAWKLAAWYFALLVSQ